MVGSQVILEFAKFINCFHVPFVLTVHSSVLSKLLSPSNSSLGQKCVPGSHMGYQRDKSHDDVANKSRGKRKNAPTHRIPKTLFLVNN